MLNQLVVVGRLVSDPEIIVGENNKKRTYITVAVPRSYKNIDGNYETDFIRCTLWNGIAESACEYTHKGDLIGIKGRIQNNNYIDSENNKFIYSAPITQLLYSKLYNLFTH